MHIIGLTGGIASGKTLAADILSGAGCTVIDADEEARAVTAAGGEAIGDIVRAFGPAMLTPEGALDRPKMRDLVFRSPERRQALERIIHPLVWERIERRLPAATGPYAVLAVPLLESLVQHRSMFSRVLVIDIPGALQLERLVRRSGLDAAQATAIIRAQAPRSSYLGAADDIIVNATSREDFRRAVIALHRTYLELFRIRPEERSFSP